MAHGKKKPPLPRRPARSHDEIPRHVDWQNPRVVQILDAASRCFARDGFDKTTVMAIAREAELTKSMIHYYFESKQVLILELQAFVHERYFRRVQQRLAAIDPSSSESVRGALSEIYELLGDKLFLRLQLELLAEAGRDPQMRQRMMLAQMRSRELIALGSGDGGVSPELAYMIASTLLGLRTQEFVGGDAELAQSAYEAFVDLIEPRLAG